MFIRIYFLLILSQVVVTNEIFENTLIALNKTLNFIFLEYKSINVDGLLGVNIANGHLIKAAMKTTNFQIEQELKNLVNLTKALDLKIFPILPNKPKKYYFFNNYVAPSRFWIRDINFTYGKLENLSLNTGPFNVTNKDEFIAFLKNSKFKESNSDKCFIEVISNCQKSQLDCCKISEYCYKKMIIIPNGYVPHIAGYGTTHMLLLLQILRNNGCKINETLFEKQTIKLCSRIFWELNQNSAFHYIKNIDDLLLEQIVLCGHEGFAEFLKIKFLTYILEIQNSSGGFSLFKSNRSKREVNFMKYGANSHSTGLGAAALALFVRVLIDKPSVCEE